MVGRALEAEVRSRPEHWLCVYRRRREWDGDPAI
jgi:hypothetical protein